MASGRPNANSPEVFVELDCSLLGGDENYTIATICSYDSVSSTVEQVTDRGFYICHTCLLGCDLRYVDTSHGRFIATAAFWARPTTVGGHFGLRVIYGSGLLDCK